MNIDIGTFDLSDRTFAEFKTNVIIGPDFRAISKFEYVEMFYCADVFAVRW